ncbi:MAG: protein kinase, partial [Duganella sp.]
NPWGAAREAAMAAAPAPTIDWQQLQLEQQLGEGASGVIHRALYRHDGGAEAVAVKLYKGVMTSDGSPLNEMSACLNVGANPKLVPVLGRLTGHPDGTNGLVMPLIDPAFINLAGPPSFASCTRDVYEDDKRFAWSHVLSIAHGVASAAAQLHAHGVLHGDLYAHNIVHNAAGHSLLGDFGAAAFYDPASPMAKALQRLEVRAFGLLLEELLSRTDECTGAGEKTAASTTKRELLRELQVACSSEDIAARPLFEGIARKLQTIRQD